MLLYTVDSGYIERCLAVQKPFNIECVQYTRGDCIIKNKNTQIKIENLKHKYIFFSIINKKRIREFYFFIVTLFQNCNISAILCCHLQAKFI